MVSGIFPSFTGRGATTHAATLVLLLAGLLGACDRPSSSGGPKVKVTPDPPPPGSFGAQPAVGATTHKGLSNYPTPAKGPPPNSPPVGKGLEYELQRYIVVDQFGYRPEMKKVAVLAEPVAGWNAGESYSPAEQLEVRKWADGSVVFSGPPVLWNGGKVDEASGDKGYWFDFSSVDKPGLYFIYDTKSLARSHPFEISKNVYKDVLVAATKMYFFNRANFAKKPPYSCVGKRCWSLGADYVRARQDREARSVTERDDPKTSRDLSGGWWDAGDTNKYVTFANDAVHTLLTAYEEHPEPFTDEFGIPESGNGTPDLLDEVKYELDWLRRMQPVDLKGGVLIKVGCVDHEEALPDQSRLPRYYYPKPCSSSTIVAAGLFAHAALVFRKVEGHDSYANDLEERAIAAYQYYQRHPRSDNCDDGTIKSGDADQPPNVQEQHSVVAAIYLYALTGEEKYGAYVASRFEKTRPFTDERWSVYDPSQGDALLFYADLPNADAKAKKAILSRKRTQASRLDFYKFRPERDLYRAFMRKDSYHWGSNRERATFGNTNYDMVQHRLAAESERDSYTERAAGMLNSFHGVNPMQLVYLTNMYAFGGDECADELFHTWFRDKHPKWDNARTSTLGPAPGYVTGGPNAQYCKFQGDDHACKKSPVRQQPPGKAYLNSNKGWEPKSPFDKSWELTEPGIYYQAAYVRLVSKFVD